MLVVALLISTIMEKIHQQAIIAGHRERRIKSIYAMNSELIAINSEDNVVRIAIKHISETFDAKVGVFLPDETGHVVLASVEETHGLFQTVIWVQYSEYLTKGKLRDQVKKCALEN